MTKEKIRLALTERALKMDFHDETHTYWLGDTQYTSVSDTLTYFSASFDAIPANVLEKAINRGNQIHSFLEWYCENLDKREAIEKKYKDHEYFPYFQRGMNKIDNYLSNGWEILATEQLMYSIPDKVAGTVDLLLYRDGEVKIVDWKSGSLKIQNYAQIGIYKHLFLKSLSRLKAPLIVTTELVSLK